MVLWLIPISYFAIRIHFVIRDNYYTFTYDLVWFQQILFFICLLRMLMILWKWIWANSYAYTQTHHWFWTIGHNSDIACKTTLNQTIPKLTMATMTPAMTHWIKMPEGIGRNAATHFFPSSLFTFLFKSFFFKLFFVPANYFLPVCWIRGISVAHLLITRIGNW